MNGGAFGPLPIDIELSDPTGCWSCEEPCDVTARVATPDDAGVLFEILSDPNLPNIPERHRPPSEEHLRTRLAQEFEAAQVAADDKLLT